MNRKYLAISLISVLTLVGCASPTYNYTPPVTQISFPAIGVITSVQVGDTLVSQGSIMQHDAIHVDSDVDVGLFKPYTITKGTFLKLGEKDDIAYYSIRNQFEGGGTIEKAALADPPKAVQAYTSENKLCGISVFNAFICSTEASYKFIKKPIASPNSFQQSLIYSGKVGSRIKFGYREFSGDTARPAFNNDVDYDLSESNIIGYKGARIEVLEATNEAIRYRLISNFNTAR